MLLDDVLKHYKSFNEISKAINVSRQAVNNWVKWGHIPPLSQLKLEEATNGLLKADLFSSRKNQQEKKNYYPQFMYEDENLGDCFVKSINFNQYLPCRINYCDPIIKNKLHASSDISRLKQTNGDRDKAGNIIYQYLEKKEQ